MDLSLNHSSDVGLTILLLFSERLLVEPFFCCLIFSQINYSIRWWINNYISGAQRDVIRHPCSNFKDGLAEAHTPGPTFIKPDQLDPWIKDQLGTVLPSTILSLQLRNFVSYGRACPSHMTQNLVTVGAKLLTGEWFLFWSLIHGSSWSGLIKVGPEHMTW